MSYLQKQKPWKRLLTLGTAAVFLGFGAPPLLQADNMRSDSYIIQFGNFNITAGEKSSSSFKVTDTVGQTAPGEYTGTGYKVLAGFQYMYAIPRFSFRITDLNIELGELTPGVFNQDSHEFLVTTRSGGYSVLARADHPLRTNGSTASIPFTSCDSSCSISSATSWTNPSNIGLGFNVTGPHKTADFSSSSFFRPFADKSAAQTPQTIVTHTGVVRDEVHQVTYKASIGGAQEAGSYATVVEYTAVPTY